jgi:hypothetical protein
VHSPYRLGYERLVLAEVVGVAEDTVRRTVSKFNKLGFPGIVNDQWKNNGRAPAITAVREAALRKALHERAADGCL